MIKAGLVASEALSPWLIDGCLFPMSSHGLPSVCICVQLCSSSKETNHTGLGPTLILT